MKRVDGISFYTNRSRPRAEKAVCATVAVSILLLLAVPLRRLIKCALAAMMCTLRDVSETANFRGCA